jgi:hypothetical protein
MAEKVDYAAGGRKGGASGGRFGARFLKAQTAETTVDVACDLDTARGALCPVAEAISGVKAPFV